VPVGLCVSLCLGVGWVGEVEGGVGGECVAGPDAAGTNTRAHPPPPPTHTHTHKAHLQAVEVKRLCLQQLDAAAAGGRRQLRGYGM
jgi:hypothetical protein